MKHQALLSSKDKSKQNKIKVSSAAILLVALRVKHAELYCCDINYITE